MCQKDDGSKGRQKFLAASRGSQPSKKINVQHQMLIGQLWASQPVMASQ